MFARRLSELLTGMLVGLIPAYVDAAVGRTTGTADVSPTGEGTYSIPIFAPPGVKNLTPELSLHYGHRQDEGIAGIGWTISGLSLMHRCPKTIAQDGAPKGVELKLSDRLCLDGNQLRRTSGTYGASGSIYRLELDSGARVTAWGTAGNGPSWFKVEQKNGLIYEYGNSADSRIESLASGFGTTAHTWAINKIEDREGNEITFTYQEDGAPFGAFRISSVKYRANPGLGVSAGYEIQFVYETQPSGDVDTEYRAGGKVVDTKRLDRIDVKYLDPAVDELVRRYELTYETSLSNAGRSRLASISECAGVPLDCLASLDFTYQNGTLGLTSEYSSGSTVPAGAKVLPMDIDGDGLMDVAFSSSAGTGTWKYRLSLLAGGYGSAVDTGISSANHAKAIVIDYNSDGRDDILVPQNGSTWWVIQGKDGGGFDAAFDSGAPATSDPGNAIALDLNGDGRDDLIWGENIGPTHYNPLVQVRYREPSGGFSSTATALFAGAGGQQLRSPTLFDDGIRQSYRNHFDVNGDGYKDIALYVTVNHMGGPTHYADIILGGGAGTQTMQAANLPDGLPIDMNGDGYTDIAFASSAPALVTQLSTGKTLLAALAGPSLTNLDFSKAVVTDWNGDGFEDIVIPNTSTNTWHYLRSQGESFANAVDTTVPTSSPTHAFAIDANGDGLTDIGYVNSSNVYAHRLRAGIKADLLDTVTDGNSNTTNFNYTSIARGSYSKTSGAVFPYREYEGPVYVVSTVIANHGVDSGTYTKYYHYYGLRRNLNGRELVGFQTRRIHDTRDGSYLYEGYLRNFPYYGRLYQRILYVNSGGLTFARGEYYNWLHHTGGSGYQTHLLPYLRSSTVRNYEVGGAYQGDQINEIVTVNSVDAYGTVTDVNRTTKEFSSSNGLHATAEYKERRTLISVTNNTVNWCLGKPSNIWFTNSHNLAHGTEITRHLSLIWDTTTYCRQTHEIVESSSSAYKVTRSIGYDGFGNVSAETVTGINMPARTSTSSWGAKGNLPVSSTNALGQTTTYNWDFGQGVLLSQTDPNGNAVTSQYDDFGRRSRVTRPDGTYSDITLTACSSTGSYCGTGYSRAKTKIRVTGRTPTGAKIRYDDTYLDRLDRPIQSERETMSGAMAMTRSTFDTRGRIVNRYFPVFGATPGAAETTLYDAVNRPITIQRPIDGGNPTLQNTSIFYEGLTTRVVDAEGKSSTKIADALGRTLRSQDHNSYYQGFNYDAFGSVVGVTDSQSNTLLSATYAYGLDAFKTASLDMNMGSWTYTLNALGEVTGYTDAKSQNFSMTYDKLSRPLTRIEAEGTTTWTWGTSAAANNIGRLVSVASPGYSESYTYNGDGKLSEVTTVSDATYHFDYGYSTTTGLLNLISYPTSTGSYRLRVKYDYQNGLLNKVSDYNSPTLVFWEANTTDARGNVTDETLGNGIQTFRGYDPVTGRIDYINSGPGGNGATQQLDYQWDKVGNLTQRYDDNRSLTEDFYYDNLHRLDYSTLNSVQNLDLSYDALGNIKTKSDVGPGTWTYHATKKHAVTNAAGNTYSYDNNGNQTSRNGNAVTWMSYNYPKRITLGSGQYHEFSYGPNRQRWKQQYVNGGMTETTITVGAGLLEKVTRAGVTGYRHYIYVGSTPVVLYERPTTGSPRREYLVHDHLGSVDAITHDTSGATIVNQSFAAFGERRDPTDWSGPPSTADKTLIADRSQHGYTDHTHLEESPLIHMNGRVADAKIGRFLSADPYVPDPGVTQSFNRYSYVNNRPMSYTDPSGFIPIPCGDSISCSFSLGASAFGFIKSLFGKKKKHIPKGCFVAPTGCYGQAGMTTVPGFGGIVGIGNREQVPWILNAQPNSAGTDDIVLGRGPGMVDGLHPILQVILDIENERTRRGAALATYTEVQRIVEIFTDTSITPDEFAEIMGNPMGTAELSKAHFELSLTQVKLELMQVYAIGDTVSSEGGVTASQNVASGALDDAGRTMENDSSLSRNWGTNTRLLGKMLGPVAGTAMEVGGVYTPNPEIGIACGPARTISYCGIVTIDGVDQEFGAEEQR